MATYENIGTHDVLGRAPGEIFEYDLDLVTEARLVSGYHLRRVTASGANAGLSAGTAGTAGMAGTSSRTYAGTLAGAQKTSSSGASEQDDAETPDADDDVAA